MTVFVFHEYASAAPHSVLNVRLSQTLHNLCGNWVLCATGNETTILHCVLLNWRAWVVSRNLRNPLRTSLVQISQVEYVPGCALFYLWEVVQIFQREFIFYSKRSSGGSLFKKLVRGNQFQGCHFLPWQAILDSLLGKAQNMAELL